MSRWCKSVVWLLVVVGCVASLCGVEAAAPHRAAEAVPAAKEEKKVRLSDTRMRDELAKTIDYHGIDDPKATLVEVLEQLSKMHRITFNIKEGEFAREGFKDVARSEVANPNPIPMMKASLRHVLRVILARVATRSAATFLIRKSSIEITTESAVRRELGLPEPKLNEDKTNQLAPTSLFWDEFREEPLEDALAQMANVMDTTILVDPRCAAKAKTKIDATLRNVPLDTAVELLAEMGGLVAVKRNNAFFVTTAEHAKAMKKAKKK